MALKHDAQGFLAGDAIDLGNALAIWDDIKKDVHAIRNAISRMSSQGAETPSFKFAKSANDPKIATPERKSDRQLISVLVSLKETSQKALATPRARDSLGRFVKSDAQPKPSAPGPAAGVAQPQAGAASVGGVTNTTSKQAAKAKLVVPTARDGMGRFEKSEKTEAEKEEDKPTPKALALIDRIASALNNTAAGANSLEEADPAIKAVQEVAQPLARGYQMLTGGSAEKKKDGWFRKIYGTLVGFRKDETAFNKAANKSLKALEDKPDSNGDNQTGFWGKILAALAGFGPFVLAALTGLISKIPGFGWVGKGMAGAAGGAAKSVGATAGSAASGGIKGAAGSVLKKIPILGTLLALGMGASDAAATEQDQTITRDQKNAKQGKTVGGVAGGLGGAAAGAAIGTLIFPGVGTVIGGVIGAVAGDWLGGNAGEIIGQNFKGITESMASGWQATTETASAAWAGVSAGFMVVSEAMGINWTAIGAGISSAWDSVAAQFTSISTGVGKSWGEFVALAKSGWDAFTGLFSSAYEGLKKIPIIGAGIQAAEDAAKATAAAAKAVADKAVTATKEAAVKAATTVKDKAVEVVDKTVAVAKDAGAAAKTAYVEKTSPGSGPAGPAPVGVVNRSAAAVGGAAGSVVNVGRNALAAGERASEMQKAVAGYTSDPKAQAMLMANMDHESAGFTRYDENLNYSSVEQIRKTFKGNKGITGMSDDQVQGLVKSPEKLANVVYADSNRGESSKLGNTEEGDGYKFRGRGALQITGRSNYAEIGKRMGMGDALEKNPDMLANDPALAAKASIEFLKMNKGRVDSALNSGDSKALRKVINGGENGLSDVVSKTAKWDQKIQSGAMGGATAPVLTASVKTPIADPIDELKGAALSTTAKTQATSPTEVSASTEVKVASLRDDPTQGGRLSYKDIGDSQFQVSDSVTGVTELATEEQANAQRRYQAKAYRDSVAAANNPETYKSGPAPTEVVAANSTAANIVKSGLPVESMAQAPYPVIAAPVQTASVSAPKVPVFSPPPVIGEAPPVINPMASSSDSKKQLTVSLAAQDVGQDLKDRRIAHIVTGGFSA